MYYVFFQMEPGSPVYSKDLAEKKNPGLTGSPGQQTAAGLPPRPVRVLLLLSDLSTEEGSSWNVTGGYGGS